MKIEEVIENVKKEFFKQFTSDFANPDLGEAEIIANSVNIIQSNLELILKEQNELIEKNKDLKNALRNCMDYANVYDSFKDYQLRKFEDLIKDSK